MLSICLSTMESNLPGAVIGLSSDLCAIEWLIRTLLPSFTRYCLVLK